jgi:ABC-type Fe3+/spermidine/putrescine transport system ATPase subunit
VKHGKIRRQYDTFCITSVDVAHNQSDALATSDRVMVANRAKIALVDGPAPLSRRPRTLPVAGFIGWPAIFDGRRDENRVVFSGSDVAAANFPTLDTTGASFAARPQTAVPLR